MEYLLVVVGVVLIIFLCLGVIIVKEKDTEPEEPEEPEDYKNRYDEGDWVDEDRGC